MRAARLLRLGLALIVAAVPAAGVAGAFPKVILSDEALLEKALAEFELGTRIKEGSAKATAHFTRAAEAFDELQRRGVHNAALYANQGNAELLAGRLAHALLAYHRGLRLAPNDSALREHLNTARSRVHYPSPVGRPQSSAWPPWAPRPTLPFTVAAFFVGYGLTCVILTRWYMLARPALLMRGILCGVLTVTCGLGVCVLHEQEAYDAREPLVIVAATDCALQSGNGRSFPRLVTLPQGLEARRLFQRGDWLQIQLSTGEIGWVNREDVLVDDPVITP